MRQPSPAANRPPRSREQWRSLDELGLTADAEAELTAEFPSAMPLLNGPDRRAFLRLMAASLALGGLGGCEPEPAEEIVPFVRDPAGWVPGAPLLYASCHVQDGIANGVLVRTFDGRPVKIEGNPSHPWSRGATDIFMQASVLDLYDPDRSQAAARLGRLASRQALENALVERMAGLRASGGRGLRILTGPTSSPSLIAELEGLLAALPEARWHVHAPIDRGQLYEGARLAFGTPLETRYAFERADLVVSLDGDFLDPGPQQAGYAGRWLERRRRGEAEGRLIELHAAAATPSLTSAKADHNLVVEDRRIEALARALLARLDGGSGGEPGSEVEAAWLARAAVALDASRGRSLVVTGATSAPATHALVHALNARLGNTGATVAHTDPLLARAAEPEASLVGLTRAMAEGSVTTLIMLDVNPVYAAPGELGFAPLLDRVEFSLHLGAHPDETAARCTWHAPLAHPLESWGDARALDGTVSLIQPTVRPLYGGSTPAELVALMRDGQSRDGLGLLQAYWRDRLPAGRFEDAWREALVSGFLAGTALPERAPPPARVPDASAPPAEGLDVVFRPDPTVWDGSRANNSWLQELPKPLLKTVWDNVIAISPALAREQAIATGEIIEVVTADGGGARGAAWVLPGQAPAAVTLYLGYGRAGGGQTAQGRGYDAFQLRSAESPWRRGGASVRKTGEVATLVTTQELHRLDGHDFVRVHTVGEPAHEEPHEHLSLYPEPKPWPRAWAMAIDLDSCIGCNACVVACQAENNIPTVGAEQVGLGRDMHWLRIDRYYEGPPEAPVTHFQPVPCMHCEQAPCEVGCPVEATLHDHEGLNLQVYNRCVGTRTCSSYCPYKVRRFNYLDYTGGKPPSIQAQRNIEVTVRGRGVMEKCTYCVQRIAHARINARQEGREIRDGEVETACQGACPTRAITFGNLSDPASAVHEARRSERHYTLLEELNTRPRTTYLAKLAPAEPEGKA